MTATMKVPVNEKLSVKAVANVMHSLTTFVLATGTIRTKDKVVNVKIVSIGIVRHQLNKYLNSGALVLLVIIDENNQIMFYC